MGRRKDTEVSVGTVFAEGHTNLTLLLVGQGQALGTLG